MVHGKNEVKGNNNTEIIGSLSESKLLKKIITGAGGIVQQGRTLFFHLPGMGSVPETSEQQWSAVIPKCKVRS